MVSGKRPVTILPAVLEQRLSNFEKQIRIAKRFAPVVHIDIVDGRFVAPRTVGRSALRRLPATITYQVHLMVQRPREWLSVVHAPLVHEYIIHAESQGISDALSFAHRAGIPLAMAISPETPVSRLRRWLSGIEKIVCLSVTPGAQGQSLQSETYGRLRALRRFDRPLAIDGGVRVENIRLLRHVGVTEFIIGSGIMHQPRPAIAYQTFCRLMRWV